MTDAWIDGQQELLLCAVQEFKAALPGWWYSLGECSVSCDASCGPDRQGPEKHLLTDRTFDNGFHADLPQPSTLAEALKNVLAQALAARDRRNLPGYVEVRWDDGLADA